MRGRKSDDGTADFGNNNAERSNLGNEKENLNSETSWDIVKTLNNFLKLNQNGNNLEEQLNIIDQTYPSLSSQQTNDGQLGLHRQADRTGYEPFRRIPMFNSRSYGSNQITPFLGLVSRYGSYGSAPKR